MSVIGSNILAGSSGVSDAYTIDQSLRFDEGGPAYLTRTQESGDSDQIVTVSFWMKRGRIDGEERPILSMGPGGQFFIRKHSDETIKFRCKQDGTERELATAAVFRDPSAWYHVVAAWDVTQATEADRMKVWVNGEVATLTGTYPIQTTSMDSVDDGATQRVGTLAHSATSSQAWDGYLAEYHYLDGIVQTASSFGETDSTTNQWKPIEYSGSYGTNGFYQKYASTVLADSFEDSSGNGSIIESFTSTGSDTWTCPEGVTEIEVLTVAGGGGGAGYYYAAGGGAGGIVHDADYTVVPGVVYI